MDAAILTVFVIDCLTRVFPATEVPKELLGRIELSCAQNEYEAAQLGIRVAEELEITAAISPLRSERGDTLPADRQSWNFAGTIRLAKSTPVVGPERLASSAPCEVPDPLRAERTWKCRPGRTEVLWLTFYVPADAPPGAYRGDVTVRAGDRAKAVVPVTIDVWPFALPRERHLQMTNWVNFDAIAASHGVELWTEPFWTVWGRYLDNLREHRQTMVWIPWHLIKVFSEDDGRLSFDYTLFDRFVAELEKHGVAERLEIQHVAHFVSGWGSPVVLSKVPVVARSTGKRGECDMTVFLKDLERHLAEKGWLSKAMVHVADEACPANVMSWREQARRIEAAAPNLRRIDAIEAADFGDDLDVWVPKLSHYVHWRESYDRAQARGKEVWYYVCCHPYGGLFPNRFLDFPIAMVRLFHWINAANDLPGYLHWGLNFWNPKDPFGTPSAELPPGDTHVLYPGDGGPLSSIRWEVQRDSVEDFEYLWLLEDRLAAAKEKLGAGAIEFSPARRRHELARLLVRDLAAPVLDPREIRAVRAQAASEIMAAAAAPLALVWTYPEDGGELVDGPAVVEANGAVEPGSTVSGIGEVAVDASGRFRASVFVSPQKPEFRIRVERAGAAKEIVRRFRFRR